MNSEPIAVYLHIPFCPSKCGYCDFNSYAMTGDIHQRTSDAIRREVERSPHAGRTAKTIFFGGGTPTYLTAEQLTAILKTVMEVHPPIPGAEVTSEANPGTIDMPKFEAMREAGFNRLSLGAQSFQSDDLLRLGRVHAANEIPRAVRLARQAGFTNLNIDLMFGLPGQSLHAWEQNLQLARDLQTEHLSLYGLTIEPNTRIYRYSRRGMLNLPDEDCQVQMYDKAQELLSGDGMDAYEISNFAHPGFQCQHNLAYWRAEPYLGYGPGAVGCVELTEDLRARTTKIKHPEHYCHAVEAGLPLTCEDETVDDATLAFERLMLGLRLAEGVDRESVHVSDEAIEKLVTRGWLQPETSRLRLTPQGRHWCSQAIVELS